MQIIKKEQGVCPQCGKEKRMFRVNITSDENDQARFNFDCLSCGCEYNEIYRIIYKHTIYDKEEAIPDE